MSDLVTKEMREVAWRAFKLSQGEQSREFAPLVEALEAVAPMIRNATLEKAAKVADETVTDEIIPAQPPTEDDPLGQPERRVRHHRGSKFIAAAILALAHSGDGEGKE